MYRFNAELEGYLNDAYVEWAPVPADSDDEYGEWNGSFDYNVGWVSRDEKVLKPGRYTLYEENTPYEIEIVSVEPKEKDIYHVELRGDDRRPSRRTWNRARDLHSTKSWDQQIIDKISSQQ